MADTSKEKLQLRMRADTRARIEQHYRSDNCKSMNEFVEKAVLFYTDYLDMNAANSLLPTSISAAIDGRLGMFENRLASLLYKQCVSIDMTNSLLAMQYELPEEFTRKLRSKSVQHVKQTNGLLSLEQLAYDGEAE